MKMEKKTCQIIDIIKSIFYKTSFLFLLVFTFWNCCGDNPIEPKQEDKGEYTIQAKYQSIRSYPEGGGIFIISIIPQNDFAGTVKLRLEADPALKASLKKSDLDNNNRVAEIIISPDKNIEINNYIISIIATHSGKEKRVQVEVELFDWTQGGIETALIKRDEFKKWLVSQNSKYNSIFNQPDKFYHTYPQILIVEHYTFLTDDYEVRICYHVMVPPDDWSFIRIRKRNSLEAEFAAKRESNGTIKSIPLTEYPTLFGY
ncbi:MAG: hypothetical protein RO257_07325 [Candidatus Kapabacteria bacterium]|nr:hypothetical protein [Candidatus Kapabacteria bacterium]